MKKIITQSIKATFLALIFGAVTVFAAPFVGPTDVPSVDNAPLPVNVSLNNQFKQGGIGISSLLVGPGSTLPGATNVSILGKLGIGSGLVFSSIPTNGISAVGMISSAQGFWSLKNISAGFASLTPPAAAGATGAVIADRFCFSGLAGTCTTTWGGGTGGSATFPAGTLGQTLYYAAAGTTVTPTSTFSINGTTATTTGTAVINGTGTATGASDVWQRFTVDKGGLHINKSGTDALFLNNTAGGASSLSVISNVPSLNFWSTDAGGHNSDINVRDVLATRNVKGVDLFASNLSNGTDQNVCANASGKLILCTTTGGGGTNPTSSMQYYQIGITAGTQSTSGTLGSSNPNTFTVPAGVTQIAVDVIGGGGGARSGTYAGGGGGRSLAFINVTPGSTFTVSVGLRGESGTCAVNTDGSNSMFTGSGYTMVASGGNKATCSAHGTGGSGLSGTGSTNLTGRTGNYMGGGYGGDPVTCTVGANSPCSSFNIAGYGRGGDVNAYDPTGGLVVVTWTNPNTSGTPVLASGGADTVLTLNTPGVHTWVVPAGITSMDIQVIGGGGGGSGGTNAKGGSGGGGGGYINSQNISVTPGQSYSMNVGSNGTGGAMNGGSGTNGTATTFNSTYVANGGTGGTTSTPGVGGTAFGPTGTVVSGLSGAAGLSASPYTGGVGGYTGGGPSFTSGKGGNGGLGFTPLNGAGGTGGAVVITYR